MPLPVLESMIDHLRLEANRGGYAAAHARSDAIADFYATTAQLLGCRDDNIAFASSATDAFSRALSVAAPARAISSASSIVRYACSPRFGGAAKVQ